MTSDIIKVAQESPSITKSSANDDMADMDISLEDYPSLQGISGFLRLIERTPWFRYLGEPLDEEVVSKARLYTDLLGFPDVWPAEVEDWAEAASVLEANDFNNPAWEAEEQLFAGVTATALEFVEEDLLSMVMSYVQQKAGEIIGDAAWDAARRWGIEDEALINAAAGSAIQCCYQVAMALAAGEDEAHPLARKFQIYETGQWPIAISGNSLNIF
ncbi:MAG: hypothetical protein CMF31_06425 [Kordiimonas sp.]|mgnify:CR=1 FL=1|nr:hypothetical protein [Kordiimonas sp.]|tara:strand:+ start:761 stop:1405 length:645 start_codon:yes stop_codon:yes gene_type:complete